MITDLKINEEKKKEYYEKGYWTRETIRDVWERQARANADKEYVADDQGCRMTYGEVDDAASRLAAWLVSQGIKPGDVVTLQFPNWAEFTIAYVACFKTGAVIQSLARNFNGADLTYAMNLVESRAYIGPTSFHGVDYEQQILDIAGDIPTLKVIALVDKKAPKQTDLPTVAEIVATTEPLAEKVPVESDQVACLLSTSGTTGKPKEVMLTHNNILFSERVFVEGLERTADDVMWMPAPLNHAVGFFHGLVAPMLLGGRSVLMQDFAVKDAIDLINAEGATWSMCSTPFIYDIVKYLDAHPDESLPTYVLHSCGGAPVPGALIDRAHNHDILLCEIFGSTESCPHVFVPPSKCVEWNGDWSGIPFPGIEVRYIDEQGNDVAPGVQGEHISRGPHQFVGAHRPRAHRRRLVVLGRLGLHGRTGAHPHQRPGQGDHHPRRREPVGPRDRRQPGGLPGRGRVGHHRHARRPPGRAHLHLRGASGGHGADPGVGHGLPGRRGRAQAPVARAHRDHRRDPRHRHWQGEALHPRANLEGAHGSGVISSPSVE